MIRSILRFIIWSPIIAINFMVSFLLGCIVPINHSIEYQVGIPAVILIMFTVVFVIGLIYLMNKRCIDNSPSINLPLAWELVIYAIPTIMGTLTGILL